MFLLSIAAAAALATDPVNIDLTRYYPSDSVEELDRTGLLIRVDSFLRQPATDLTTPGKLAGWLEAYEELLVGLQKHDAYVYVCAERDQGDKAHAAADDKLESELDGLNAGLEQTLAGIGAPTLRGLLDADPALQPYRYFVTHALDRAKHASENQKAVEVLAGPTIASLKQSYKSLRQHVLAAPAGGGEGGVNSGNGGNSGGGGANTGSGAKDGAGGRDAFLAKWTPYAREEAAFAAILIPLAVAQNGSAALQSFDGAPEAAYSRADLSPELVHRTLAAVRGSLGVYAHYHEVVALAAAQRTGVSQSDIHTWDLDSADSYSPPSVTFPDAVASVLAAVKPMGKIYAQEYERLFDPKAHRVEWCHASGCDDAGFSIGYAGVTSGLFYGNFAGSTDSMRAVAHEAGHAVHRQFMNESQPRAVYNSGPHFLFESFAIFNELLFLDHLARTAPTTAAQAYYTHRLLERITFQVYGSARETELEESIYAGVRANTIRGASDLDQLTAAVFSRYASFPEADMKVYWATNRLYFTDPFYDVNYLYAGLLALEYLRLYEQDPKRFAPRYVAMLQNGFTASPAELLRAQLGIDFSDMTQLVADGQDVIRRRTVVLEGLYRGK